MPIGVSFAAQPVKIPPPILLTTVLEFAKEDEKRWTKKHEGEPEIIVVDPSHRWMARLASLVASRPDRIIQISGHGYPGNPVIHDVNEHPTTLSVENLAKAIAMGRNEFQSGYNAKYGEFAKLPPVLVEFRSCGSGVYGTGSSKETVQDSTLLPIAKRFVQEMLRYQMVAISSGVLGKIRINIFGKIRVTRYSGKKEGYEAVAQFAPPEGVPGGRFTSHLPGTIRGAETFERDRIDAEAARKRGSL